MSIYLKDSSILLDSDKVATSADCCCGGVCCDCDGNCDPGTDKETCESDPSNTWVPNATCDDDPSPCKTGACCDDTDCSIKTQACCENDDGDYQGDDSVCDPNPCKPPCNCAGFTNDLLPGRVFLSLETHGNVLSTFGGTDCSNPTCFNSFFPCDNEQTCDGSGASSSIDNDTCVETPIDGTWNNINTRRSVCVGAVCAEQPPVPPDFGSYAAGSAHFCNLDVPPLVYSVSGTTVHGTFTTSLSGDCGGSGTETFDIYHVYSDECIP